MEYDGKGRLIDCPAFRFVTMISRKEDEQRGLFVNVAGIRPAGRISRQGERQSFSDVAGKGATEQLSLC
jgi:hypothetical protein